jgi:putative FmdB family regulatory protein
MPTYEFHCEGCKTDFDHMTSISSRDKKIPCPNCGSKKTGRKLSSPAVGSGKSSGGGGGGGGGGCCGGGCRCGH